MGGYSGGSILPTIPHPHHDPGVLLPFSHPQHGQGVVHEVQRGPEGIARPSQPPQGQGVGLVYPAMRGDEKESDISKSGEQTLAMSNHWYQ